MPIFREALAIVREHRKAFVVLAILFYGILLTSMGLTLLSPDMQAQAQPGYDLSKVDNGIIKQVVSAYTARMPFKAIALTFAVNLSVAIALTTLPSLLVPFSGIASTLHRSALWGVLFAPIGVNRAMFVPHFPTLLLEGLGYLLAAFAAYVHGMMVLKPERYGLTSRWQGYKGGFMATARLYVLVVAVLLVAAVYEAFEALYVMPRFFR